MLLKSSLFILLLVNIFTSNLIILSAILIVVLILNLTLNKNLKKHVRQLKILLFFYLSTFLIQLYYGQQGKVLFKFYSFYITQEGLINFGVSFIRILNLILMSCRMYIEVEYWPNVLPNLNHRYPDRVGCHDLS